MLSNSSSVDLSAGKVPPAPHGTATVELWGLFQAYRSRPFVFVQPGGNAGDYLIYKGAEKLGRLAGLDFTSVSHDTFMQAEYGPEMVVYIHGGGGYNPIWSGKPMEAIQLATQHRGVVIQGPQTFWNDYDFLKERVVKPMADARCERLVLMARERVSYDLMQKVLPSSFELLLDHDTALNLQREDLRELLPDHSGNYKLYAIREDKEARGDGLRDYFSVWLDPVRHRSGFEAWLQVHARAREIVTNRLHSSICGSILGIPTTLLPNSYFKNRAVWEHSLSERGVQWGEHVQAGAASRLIHKIGPLRKVLDHPRVQRQLIRFYGA